MARYIWVTASTTALLLGACATTGGAIGELGSMTNPILADTPSGEQAYLRRLRCHDGSAPAFGRIGSMNIIHGRHVIDGFDVKCPGKEARTLYMDMYHPKHIEAAAPTGFTIVPA